MAGVDEGVKMAIEQSVRIDRMPTRRSADQSTQGLPEMADSPLEWAAERVGDRWTLLIVNALLTGPLRFGELAEALPGIATNVLSQRLKRLEGDRLVASTAYSARPPRFSYELTRAGRELGGVLGLLAHWGAVAGGGEGVRHTACGTLLEARWWCPTCDRPVDDPDDDGGLRFV
jgi:DNA-binding HxlR family transcriptional regulator